MADIQSSHLFCHVQRIQQISHKEENFLCSISSLSSVCVLLLTTTPLNKRLPPLPPGIASPPSCHRPQRTSTTRSNLSTTPIAVVPAQSAASRFPCLSLVNEQLGLQLASVHTPALLPPSDRKPHTRHAPPSASITAHIRLVCSTHCTCLPMPTTSSTFAVNIWLNHCATRSDIIDAIVRQAHPERICDVRQR